MNHDRRQVMKTFAAPFMLAAAGTREVTAALDRTFHGRFH